MAPCWGSELEFYHNSSGVEQSSCINKLTLLSKTRPLANALQLSNSILFVHL